MEFIELTSDQYDSANFVFVRTKKTKQKINEDKLFTHLADIEIAKTEESEEQLND